MIVVTGATGNVGRPLVRELAAAGEQVTAVSRKIPAEEAPAGVRYRQADLADTGSLKPALDGASALFVLTSGDFMAAGGDLGQVMDAARAAGVGRVVLLSTRGVLTGRHPAELEEIVTGSGMDWTLLRPGGFASNTLLWAQTVRTQRMVAAPFGDVALPVVDPADIAAVAAVALTGEGHAGQAYELTGPAAVSPREQAAAIGRALGEPVRFVEQTRDEARTQLLRFMPEEIVAATLDVLGEPGPAEQQVSPDAERVLGRAPRSYADWAQHNIAAFR